MINKIIVTGGASFIGSHLCEKLISLGNRVVAIDNLSTGKREYLKNIINNKNFKFIEADLRSLNVKNIFDTGDMVYHLAAVHGGREFISKYPADCCQSLQINENVFRTCVEKKIRKIIFSSSVCVYPLEIQLDGVNKVKENDVSSDGWYKPDGEYGWVKLTAEKSLKAYNKQYGLNSAIVRYTTVYGPRENDTHAIIALIKRALNKEDPYLIWGSGNQGRDFIYVDDVVNGTILASDRVNNSDVINLVGTKMITIKELANNIFKILDWYPTKIVFDKTKPEGPKKRLISCNKAISLGFKPTTSFCEGLKETIKWLK